MLESFSVQAVQIIEDAKKIASNLNQTLVGSEHLLLAMYETPDSICRFLLQEKEITYDDLLDSLNKITVIHKKGTEELIFTDKFQEIVLQAEEIAENVGSNYVFDEHLFYSMLKDDASVASEMLKSLQLDFQDLMKDIEDIFNFYDQDELEFKSPFPFLINLSKEKAVHPYIQRNNYIERINYILNKKQKNNPLLIGSAGVGKTAIIEGLAALRTEDTIYQLDLGGTVAGTKYRGELEEKLLKVMDYIKESHAILFIDEIHNVVGAGSNDGSLDIANILKPYLSRTDISVIGATTLEEYYKFIDKDKALMRRFQTIFIDEPTKEETKTILLGIKDKYEEYHQVTFQEEDIHQIIHKCALFLPQRTFPDKAIDVMDEVGARYHSYSDKKYKIEDLIDVVIKDMTNIYAIPVEKIQTISLNYPMLRPYYIQFLEKVHKSNHLFLANVDTHFVIQPLLEDLEKVFNFKEEMYLELNLENYQDSTMVNNLIGSSKGYVGYEQGGILSEHIIKYPMCMVNFKNMKYVHPSILAFIEKIIKVPFFMDNKGRKINLQNTIFLIDYQGKKENVGFLSTSKEMIKKLVLPTIEPKHQKEDEYYHLMKKYNVEIEGFETLSEEEKNELVFKAICEGIGKYKITEDKKMIKVEANVL